MNFTEAIKKGVFEINKKNYPKAEKIFLSVYRLQPNNIAIYSYLVPTFIYQKKFIEASKFAQRLVNINNKSELGFLYLGIINFEIKNYNEAINFFTKSLQINQKNVDALVNLGACLHKIGESSEAIKNLNYALNLNQNNFKAYHNLAVIYEDELEFDKAIENYKKSLFINSNDYESLHGLSLMYLTKLDYERGLKIYENRWHLPDRNYRYHNFPKLSQLENIANKKILIWHEQGLGDTIQFSRYIKELIDLNAKVTFEVQKPLEAFIKRQLNCEVTTNANINNHYDFQCPLLTLPLLFKTNHENIPTAINFTSTEDLYIKWNKILAQKNDKINVGIAISGNPNQKNDLRRKIDLEYFLKLKSYCNLFLIQKDLYEKDRECLNKNNFIRFMGDELEWKDFEDTSAIIDNMDIIITICTSMVHLAASMNKNTILLLSKPSDWRWGEENNKAPKWYPNLKILRQHERKTWNGLMPEIEQILNQLKNKI